MKYQDQDQDVCWKFKPGVQSELKDLDTYEVLELQGPLGPSFQCPTPLTEFKDGQTEEGQSNSELDILILF